MATRHGRSKPSARLRCDALEPRDTPAALDFGAGFTAGPTARRAAGRVRGRRPPADRRPVPGPGRLGPDPGGRPGLPDVVRLPAGDDDPAANGPRGTGSRSPWRRRPAGRRGGRGRARVSGDRRQRGRQVRPGGQRRRGGRLGRGVHRRGRARPRRPSAWTGPAIHFHSGHPFRADLAYDGAVLALTLTDTIAPDRVWTGTVPRGHPGGRRGRRPGTPGSRPGPASCSPARPSSRGRTLETADRPTITGMHARSQSDDRRRLVLWATATDDGAGRAALTYTWEVVSAPPGGDGPCLPVRARLPDGRDSRSSGTGPYTFRLTVRDADGQTATSDWCSTTTRGTSRASS